MMSKIIGLLFLVIGGFAVFTQVHPAGQKALAHFQVTYECANGKATGCAKYAEKLLRRGDSGNAIAALEMNCRRNETKSCYRLGQVFERQDDIERANLYYEFACQSSLQGACETYGQFLAGPALGRIDGVPSMKVACSAGEAEACAFVAAAAYASGNNHDAYKYWAHVCQKLGQTNVCLWGARKFEENGQAEYGLALEFAACQMGIQKSCEVVKNVRDQKAQLIQAQNEAKVAEQKRALASIAKAKSKLPTKLPPKKKR